MNCRGAPLGFTLDESRQEALVAAVALGTDSVLCMRFGGKISRDQSTAHRSVAIFSARDAPAPSRCTLL